jgi:hypothetical protein
MKEELVRTEEENVRHKQLVDRNRKRREALQQQQEDNLALIPQVEQVTHVGRKNSQSTRIRQPNHSLTFWDSREPFEFLPQISFGAEAMSLP